MKAGRRDSLQEEIPPIHAKFTRYSSKKRKQSLLSPIFIPILKARPPAHDGRRRHRREHGRPHFNNIGGQQPFSPAFGNDQDAPISDLPILASERGGWVKATG